MLWGLAIWAWLQFTVSVIALRYDVPRWLTPIVALVGVSLLVIQMWRWFHDGAPFEPDAVFLLWLAGMFCDSIVGLIARRGWPKPVAKS
ncbi:MULTISPECIES: hypothetical protein [unclassified Sphingomonas]|uniref:hypothetical protein n=1 Tax=unclassified Sphingomonas TaxID=196159 RepID=UPI000B2995F9|nr:MULTISPECIES: hypothetical protein [unclassified Sphingomonas]